MAETSAYISGLTDRRLYELSETQCAICFQPIGTGRTFVWHFMDGGRYYGTADERGVWTHEACARKQLEAADDLA